MASRTFINQHSSLRNALAKRGYTNDIRVVAFAPGGGYIIVNNQHARSWKKIPKECVERIDLLRKAGHRIRCIAFPPAGGNSWSIITDRSFYNRNIPDECHEQMGRFLAAGKPPIWVAFPPAGGNSWSILAEDTFFNRNIPEECHQRMGKFKARGEHPVCVAFSARGGNSWTIVTRRRTFNRNAPTGLHDRMSMLKKLGHPTDIVAFDPDNVDRWALVSNGHANWLPFKPSIHGFNFDNPRVPVTINIRIYFFRKSLTQGMTVCGGMAHAAKEHYIYQFRVPRIPTPPSNENESLFKYLFNRQIETLGGGIGLGGSAISTNPGKIIPWATYFYNWWKSDDYLLLSRSWREWEILKKRLDRGELVLLGLIYSDAEKLWDNHQVLAYSYYQADSDGEGVIWVYDPNRKNDDDNRIEFSTRKDRDYIVGSSGSRLRTMMSRITQYHTPIRNRQSIRKLRGFFVMEPNGKSAQIPATIGNISMRKISVEAPPDGIPDSSPPRT